MTLPTKDCEPESQRGAALTPTNITRLVLSKQYFIQNYLKIQYLNYY